MLAGLNDRGYIDNEKKKMFDTYFKHEIMHVFGHYPASVAELDSICFGNTTFRDNIT